MNYEEKEPGEEIVRKVALLLAGDTIEDWLESAALSFEDLRDRIDNGWMVGYLNALKTAQLAPVVVCCSRRLNTPTRYEHRPTGTPLWMIPVPRTFRSLQRLQKRLDRPGRTGRIAQRAVGGIGHYLSTDLRSLRGVLHRERCEALMCQEYENPRFDICVLAPRALGIPVFGVFQGGSDPGRLAVLRRTAVRRAAGLIIASESEMERVVERYQLANERLARVFNPIDADAWSPIDRSIARAELGIPENAQVVVWHGVVDVERKGLDVLAEAWRQVVDRRPDRELRLMLVGAGADGDRFREIITAAGVPNIYWLDKYVTDQARIRTHLSAADIYVLPSRREGFSVAVLEAMACELPVVASAVSGIRDVLSSGEASSGIVVPAGEPTALANALGGLLDDPARARLLGQRARRRIDQEFSVPSVGRRLRLALFGQAQRAAGLVTVQQQRAADGRG